MKESIKKDIYYIIEDIEDFKLLKKIKFILIGMSNCKIKG